MFEKIAYRPESRRCFKCGALYITNSYKHETNCPSCNYLKDKKCEFCSLGAITTLQWGNTCFAFLCKIHAKLIKDDIKNCKKQYNAYHYDENDLFWYFNIVIKPHSYYSKMPKLEMAFVNSGGCIKI